MRKEVEIIKADALKVSKMHNPVGGIGALARCCLVLADLALELLDRLEKLESRLEKQREALARVEGD